MTLLFWMWDLEYGDKDCKLNEETVQLFIALIRRHFEGEYKFACVAYWAYCGD